MKQQQNTNCDTHSEYKVCSRKHAQQKVGIMDGNDDVLASVVQVIGWDNHHQQQDGDGVHPVYYKQQMPALSQQTHGAEMKCTGYSCFIAHL